MTLAEILDDWPLWGLSKKPIENSQVSILEGGLTNTCYQLSLDSGDYIIRISAANTVALGIDRNVEKAIHQLVSSLNFTSAIRYCDDDHRYWIRDYIEGEVLADNVTDISHNTLSYMVEQLKALHQIPIEIELPVVNISEKAEAYWKMLATQQPDNEILKMKPLMQVAMSEPPAGDFCLCHLDPVLANWLYTPEGLQLLDWEYAGFAHPLWDLAALFQGIKHSIAPLEKKSKKNSDAEIEEDLENQILALYGVSDLVAWRRACLQMEYLSSLWYQAQAKTASY
ncbi:MAG: thiamine kinase-like enzyme [Oleispira sp.]|jgi:thiamine kinase-like enzyme